MVATSKTCNKAHKSSGWNVCCDTETHEALDILREWMVGKMPQEVKESVRIPKAKMVKILATEKLEKLGLLTNSSQKNLKQKEVAS